MRNGSVFNFQQMHKVNLKIVILIVFILNGPLIHAKGLADAMLYIGTGIFIIAMMTVNYFAKIPDRLKALLFVLIPGLVVVGLVPVDNYSLNKHYLILVTVMMAVVYFDKKLFLSYAAFIWVALVLLYITVPEKLMGQNTTLTMFLTVILVYSAIIYLLMQSLPMRYGSSQNVARTPLFKLRTSRRSFSESPRLHSSNRSLAKRRQMRDKVC